MRAFSLRPIGIFSMFSKSCFFLDLSPSPPQAGAVSQGGQERGLLCLLVCAENLPPFSRVGLLKSKPRRDLFPLHFDVTFSLLCRLIWLVNGKQGRGEGERKALQGVVKYFKTAAAPSDNILTAAMSLTPIKRSVVPVPS